MRMWRLMIINDRNIISECLPNLDRCRVDCTLSDNYCIADILSME
jgi:hypothetical protein